MHFKDILPRQVSLNPTATNKIKIILIYYGRTLFILLTWYIAKQNKTKQKVHTSGKCENPVISTIWVLHSGNYRLII